LHSDRTSKVFIGVGFSSCEKLYTIGSSAARETRGWAVSNPEFRIFSLIETT
jgi:hypothetical protein